MEEVEVDGIKITSLYAAYLEEHSTAVVADFHIGYESYLQHEGVSIPRYQKDIILKRLERIISKYEVERIVINGDFKHEFGKNLRQEWREAEEILSFLVERVEVVMVRGNHDNFLKTIASRYGVEVRDEYSLGNFKMVHGHRMVKGEGKKLLLGHEHPSLSIRDAVGAMVKMPCYLCGNGIVVLPAISPLATGTDVLEGDFLSPILKNVDKKGMKVYAINHDELLYFSTIGDLRKAI